MWLCRMEVVGRRNGLEAIDKADVVGEAEQCETESGIKSLNPQIAQIRTDFL